MCLFFNKFAEVSCAVLLALIMSCCDFFNLYYNSSEYYDDMNRVEEQHLIKGRVPENAKFKHSKTSAYLIYNDVYGDGFLEPYWAITIPDSMAYYWMEADTLVELYPNRRMKTKYLVVDSITLDGFWRNKRTEKNPVRFVFFDFSMPVKTGDVD